MPFEELEGYPLKGMPYYQEGRAWVSPMNFLPENMKNIPDKILIHDVTLRDGNRPLVIFTLLTNAYVLPPLWMSWV